MDLLKYPRSILLRSAIWPQRKYSVLYKLRTTFTLINIVLLTLCLAYNANFHSDDFIKLSESLYMLISVVNSLIKVVMISVNGETLLKLLSMVDIASFENYGKLYGSLKSDFIRTTKKVHLIYWIQVNGTVIFTSLFPVLESKSLPMDFPYFNNGIFHFPFYGFETLSLFIAAYNNMAIDLLTVGFISIATIQLKILNRKLVDTEENVKKNNNYSEEETERLTLLYLNECVIHYSDIEEFVKCLLRVFSVIIFVQLGTSVVAICNSGMLILTVEPISIEALSLFLYLTTMFAQLGMYCLFGNFVYLESLEVNTSCYMSEWHLRGTAIRKTLFMLMERTKRPLQIRGLNFVTLSLDTFIAILKWSYSYFTLLKNYTMKQN